MASTEATAPAANGLSQHERERMLFSVANMIGSEMKRAGIPERFWEDVEQEMQLALWPMTLKFDPNRGAKWSTLACSVLRRALMNWKVNNNREIHGNGVVAIGCARDFDAIADYRASVGTEPDEELEDGELGDTGAGLLANGVRRVLAEGILNKLGPGHRRLVELVAFEGLTADQIAEQDGHPVKVVRTNLKNAIRCLCAAGLANHAVSDEAIRAATAPAVPVSDERRQKSRLKEWNRGREDRQIVKDLVALLATDGAADALDGFGAEVEVVARDVAAKRLRVSQGGTRLKLQGAKTRDLFHRVIAALKAHPANEGVEAGVARTRNVVADLEVAAGRDGFSESLAKLDADMTIIVLALIDKSFTLDEAVELLGGDRVAAIKRLRYVRDKLAKR